MSTLAAAEYARLAESMTATERMNVEKAVALLMEIRTPLIIKQELDRQKEVRDRMSAGGIRFTVMPAEPTIDALRDALERELQNIVGELYDKDVPAGAVRAEISVEFFKV